VWRTLSEHFAASVTFVAGQNTLLNWRDRIAAQLWLTQRLTSHLSVGVGADAFVVSADDSIKDADAPANVAAMVSDRRLLADAALAGARGMGQGRYGRRSRLRYSAIRSGLPVLVS